jgi:hypothetical protein
MWASPAVSSGEDGKADVQTALDIPRELARFTGRFIPYTPGVEFTPELERLI